MGNTNQNSCYRALEELLSVRFFKALSDPNRLHILSHLAKDTEPRTVSQVCSCCPTDVSVVSRHLSTLRDAGIVESKKRGKEVFYTLSAKEIVSTLRKLADAIEECCPGQRGWEM